MKRTDMYYLAVGIALPMALRAAWDFIVKKVYEKVTTAVCGGDPFTECVMPTRRAPEGYAAAPGETVQVVANLSADYDPDSVTLHLNVNDWEEARKKLGWSRCMALCAAALRLILWHALQPLAYAATLWAFYQRLDPVQQILACVVLGREALFILLLVIACCVPARHRASVFFVEHRTLSRQSKSTPRRKGKPPPAKNLDNDC